MLERELVTRAELEAAFAAIEPQLLRYPALDPRVFRAKRMRFLGGVAG